MLLVAVPVNIVMQPAMNVLVLVATLAFLVRPLFVSTCKEQFYYDMIPLTLLNIIDHV